MGSIKIQKRKRVRYPGICPVCEKAGKLVGMPVGSILDFKTEEKLRIPIHIKCWAKRSAKLILYSSVVILVTIKEVGSDYSFR